MDNCKGSKDALHSHCGRLCSKDKVTYLVTRLELVEGEILERIENSKEVTVHTLMEAVEWEPCAVAMAIGSLIRQGVILGVEDGENVILRIS